MLSRYQECMVQIGEKEFQTTYLPPALVANSRFFPELYLTIDFKI